MVQELRICLPFLGTRVQLLKIPHAAEQLSPRATTTEARAPRACAHNRRSRHSEKPAHHSQTVVCSQHLERAHSNKHHGRKKTGKTRPEKTLWLHWEKAKKIQNNAKFALWQKKIQMKSWKYIHDKDSKWFCLKGRCASNTEEKNTNRQGKYHVLKTEKRVNRELVNL